MFYPVAFLIKTPVPFLLLVFLGALSVPKAKLKLIIVPVVSYALILMVAEKQHGVRYLLPTFPFLCLMIGGIFSTQNRWRKWMAMGLVAWMGLEAFSIYPNYLTYFNQIAGGPRRGYQWLVDCNLDWGQDFPAVRQFLAAHEPVEKMVATFGPADRDYYFGSHQDLLADANNPSFYFHHINSDEPKKEYLIVSASLLQGFGLSDPNVFAWLRAKEPLAQVANSTFVYDITSDAVSQFNAGVLYQRNGQFDFALRQFRRAQTLRPDDPTPPLAISDTLKAKAAARRP